MDKSSYNPIGGRLNALERLTEREKDCLRRLLGLQTAKEIAIDLSLSHHAVEKRLKMARAKLGVSSSLQAARLLEEYEGYQRWGPHQPYLDTSHRPRHTMPIHKMTIGVSLMGVASILLTFLVNGASPPPEPSPLPKPDEVVITGPVSFDEIDKNKSGSLEGDEAPVLARVGGNPNYERLPDGSVSWSGDYLVIDEGKSLRDRFYGEADTDRDGQVSRSEFGAWARPELDRAMSPQEKKQT